MTGSRMGRGVLGGAGDPEGATILPTLEMNRELAGRMYRPRRMNGRWCMRRRCRMYLLQPTSILGFPHTR